MRTASQVVLMLDKLQEKIKALVCLGDSKLVRSCSFMLFLTAVLNISASFWESIPSQYEAGRLSGSQVSEAAFPWKTLHQAHVEHKFQQDGSWPRADPNGRNSPRRRWRPKSDLPSFCVRSALLRARCQATAIAMKPAD